MTVNVYTIGVVIEEVVEFVRVLTLYVTLTQFATANCVSVTEKVLTSRESFICDHKRTLFKDKALSHRF